MNQESHFDTAIVGAGPGGLYLAWRLATAGCERIAVFDALGRCGGRVDSVEGLGFTADIGAMRFINSHAIINGLISHFELETFEHRIPIMLYHLRGRNIGPAIPPEVKDKYLKGRRKDGYTLAEFTHEDGPRKQTAYSLTPEEERVSPDDLLLLAIGKILSRVVIPDNHNSVELKDKLAACDRDWRNIRFKSFSIDEWMTIKEWGAFDGTQLHCLSLWELVSATLSDEAFALARDCMGYHTIFGPWNAAEHIPWFLAEFSADPYRSVVGGMGKLITRLHDATTTLLQPGRKWFHPLHTLKSISEKNGKCNLRFDVAAPGGKTPNAGSTVEFTADRVMLSVSAGALRKIEFPPGWELCSTLKNECEAATFAESLDCLSANTLMKAFALYENPWYWEALGQETKCRLHAARRVILDKDGSWDSDSRWKLPTDAQFVAARIQTNLPIRQLYLFGPGRREGNGQWRRPDGKPALGLIMAYCDAAESEYWAVLARKRNQVSVFTAKKAYLESLSEEERESLVPYAIGPQFYKTFNNLLSRVAEAMRKEDRASTVRGQPTVPNPVAMVFKNWNDPPFFGGWHAWKMTYRPWLIRPGFRTPFVGKKVHVCGEAVSSDQGWVEGALKTAEAVLRYEYKLDTPNLKGMATALDRAGFAEKGDTQDRSLDRYLKW